MTTVNPGQQQQDVMFLLTPSATANTQACSTRASLPGHFLDLIALEKGVKYCLFPHIKT